MSVAVALAADALWGEPPARVHPVALLGRTAHSWFRGLEGRGRRAQLLGGAARTSLLVVGAGVTAGLIDRACRGGRMPAALVGGAVRWPAFAGRMLWDEALAVAEALDREDMALARRHARALVSRPLDALGPALLASAAVESVAENLCDSVVAPWWWHAVGGAGGMWAYRAGNTLDAMVGYHGATEWSGKGAARLDDLLGYWPARLSALLLALALPGGGLAALACAGAGSLRRAGGVLRAASQEQRRFESPNAGWPIAVVAHGLGVRLEKPGAYVVNETGRIPGPADIRRAVTACRRAAGVCYCLALAAG